MASISFLRQLQTISSEFDGDVNAGYLAEIGNKFYLPLTFDNFTAPNISVPGVTLTNAATKLVGTPGSFDNLRVGDIISSSSTGTLAAPSTVARTVWTAKATKFVVYADTFSSTTLGVSAGDAVAGTGVAANTVVDRIDYSNRLIYLDKALTASAETELTFTPPNRVTAVRPSTATANANEVDISGSVSSTGANSTVVFQVGAREAVHTVLRLEPVNNTTGSKVNINISIAYLNGKLAQGNPSGLNGIDVASLTYIGLAPIGFDGDTFLMNARLPRPTSV